MNDQEKLAKYETAFKEVCASYNECAKELARLRADGQIKSVKFRESLGRKMILSNIILIFESHGIKRSEE